MPGRPTFAALFLAAAVSGASGLEALLGDVFVTLPPPAGFCDLSPRYEFDGRMVTIIARSIEKTGNKLLSMSADCGQLAEARAGRRRLLDDYAQYQTQIAAMTKPPAESVAQTCTTLRSRSNTIGSDLWPDIKARIDSTLKKIKMNESIFLGVVAEDANACYAALIQKLRTEAGTEKTQVAVYAVTIIRNRSMAVDRYAVYQNPDTVNAVLAKLTLDVAALIAANP